MVASPASGRAVSETLCRARDGHAAARVAFIACALTLALPLAGCYQRSELLPQSEGHITAPAPQPALSDVPPPVRVSSFVPEPRPAVRLPTYSVVVNEVPVKELLLALARDTRQNIDIHPALQGLVSLNAIDETLPAILDRLTRQVNLRYRQEGTTLAVTPDSPYLKIYRVDYVNMTRDTNSSIGVSGQIGVAAGGTTTGGAGTNASQTSVQTKTKSGDFWDLLRDNIRAILNSTRQQSQTAEARAERAATIRQEQEFQIRQLDAASRAGAGAQGLASAVMAPGGSLQPSSLVPDDVAVNPVAGSVSVMATERQHALIQQFIDNVTVAAQRQVLIEATIVEVRLSDRYRAGVDWSRLAVSGGITFNQSLLGGNLGTAPNFTIGYANPTSPVGNLAAAIRLLDQFGNTRVLSSPKLMAINNQTALLKVVDNVVYFSLSATTTASANAPAVTTFTSTAQTVPVGVIMGITAQINENGQVTMTVRPSISRILSFINDPNPDLARAGVTNPVPQIQTREMESVLQVGSGQTVILGGLMQDDVERTRDSIPGLGSLPRAGDLFAYRDENQRKTELVIFLRPTVVTNPTLGSDELKFLQRFLPQQGGAQNESHPGLRSGAIK